jgi:hypothetical protein
LRCKLLYKPQSGLYPPPPPLRNFTASSYTARNYSKHIQGERRRADAVFSSQKTKIPQKNRVFTQKNVFFVQFV